MDYRHLPADAPCRLRNTIPTRRLRSNVGTRADTPVYGLSSKRYLLSGLSFNPDFAQFTLSDYCVKYDNQKLALREGLRYTFRAAHKRQQSTVRTSFFPYFLFTKKIPGPPAQEKRNGILKSTREAIHKPERGQQAWKAASYIPARDAQGPKSSAGTLMGIRA